MGFHARRWSVVDGDETSLELELVSPDGDQGFPGAVTARVRYAVSDDTVTIEHRAETDAPTVVSLTNHAYFNLAGHGAVDDHRLTLAADAYLPVDPASIPLGWAEPVQDSVFDFRDGCRAARPGALRRTPRCARPAASTTPSSCPVTDCTSRPGSSTRRRGRSPRGLHHPALRSGLHGQQARRHGGRPRRSAAGPRGGIALECQGYPDAPNQPDFPSAVLRPGEQYRATTVWRFSGR